MATPTENAPTLGEETTLPGGAAAPAQPKPKKPSKVKAPAETGVEAADETGVEAAPFTLDQIDDAFLKRVADYIAGSFEAALSGQSSSDLADLCESGGPDARRTATFYLYDRTLKQGFDDGRDDPVATPKTNADFWKKARQESLVVLLTPVKKPRAIVRFADKLDWTKGFSWTAPSHPNVTPGAQGESTYEFRPGFVTPVEARHLLALFSSVPMSLVEVAPPVSLASNTLIGGSGDDPFAHVRGHFIPRADDEATA